MHREHPRSQPADRLTGSLHVLPCRPPLPPCLARLLPLPYRLVEGSGLWLRSTAEDRRAAPRLLRLAGGRGAVPALPIGWTAHRWWECAQGAGEAVRDNEAEGTRVL